MKKLPILKAGDSIEFIAPASRITDKQLADLINLVTSWKLNCIVPENIFGEDLLCANSDKNRFELIKNAFENPLTKAILCVRGGYGSTRLIPEFHKITPPKNPKLFIGMSDITALSLYLMQKWKWPTLHGAAAQDKFSDESIQAVKSFLFGEKEQIEMTGIPLNDAAKKNKKITAEITGGNLCIIQTGIGTNWQMDARDKIILLEEVDERGYRVDRMLEHLKQANILQGAKAIIFGDFTKGNEPDGSSKIPVVLQRFAEQSELPVLQIKGIGHDQTSFPLPLGTAANLQLGPEIKLTSER